jgi:uncharacterized membrane protein YheB (UPF0754 family)
MSSTSVATTQNVSRSFEEAIKDRLRKDIGELLPDQVLAELVKKAVQDLFFTERVENKGSYNERRQPSWFVEEAGKLIKAQLGEAITAYMTEHKEQLGRVLADHLRDNIHKILADLVVECFTYRASQLFSELSQSLEERLRRVAGSQQRY